MKYYDLVINSRGVICPYEAGVLEDAHKLSINGAQALRIVIRGLYRISETDYNNYREKFDEWLREEEIHNTARAVDLQAKLTPKQKIAMADMWDDIRRRHEGVKK